MQVIKGLVLTAGFAATLAGPAVCAQAPAEAKLRDQLRQTILELRQMQDENASLKSQLSGLSAAQDAAKQLERSLAEARRRAARVEELEGAQNELRGNLQGLQALNARQTAAMTLQQQQQQALDQKLKETLEVVTVCTTRNARLVGLSDELVQKYRDRGFADVLLANEPLTGLRRVELEKLAQDYRGKILDQQMVPAAPADRNNSP